MRNLLIVLCLAVLIMGPVYAQVARPAGNADSTKVYAVAENPTPKLDGIDWDEWLLLDGIDWSTWLMLDGIDWDEWLDSIGLGPSTRAA